MGVFMSRLLLPAVAVAAVTVTAMYAAPARPSYHQSTTVHTHHQSTTMVVTRSSTTTLSTAHHARLEAADAAFQAIADAAEAATSYISTLSQGVTSAAANGYEALLRAGAEASRLAVALVECLYGNAAALAAQVRLSAVNFPIGVADVSMVVSSLLEVITGVSSAIVPVAPSGTIVRDVPSRMEMIARSSTLQVMGLLGGITASGDRVGFAVPMPVQVAIGVMAVVGQLAQAITMHSQISPVAQ